MCTKIRESTPSQLPSQNSPNLRVIQLHPSDYQDDAKTIIDIWVDRMKTYPARNERLDDCEEVCNSLSKRLISEPSEESRKIYVCLDPDNLEQGFMALEERTDHIEIKELVTNPWNIAPEIVSEARPVKGAGKALLQAAIGLNKTIILDAYPRSAPFYASLGFQALTAPNGLSCEMILDPKFSITKLQTFTDSI